LAGGACKTGLMLEISCPSLIGRADEMATLGAALDQATAGCGSVVWVTGEAGIGKSRLLAEFGDAVTQRGIPVLTGRAVDTRTPVPFRPLFEALSGHFRQVGATAGSAVQQRALAQIVPEWRVPGEEPYQASPMEIGEGLLRFLSSITDDVCVVLLEDLHWADPETAAVLEYVADNVATARVLCIATTRLGQSENSDRVLHDLLSRGSVTHLSLRRLDRDELATMTSTCLGVEAVGADVTSLIDNFADGLPLLVEELLTTSVADGTIKTSADGWRVVSAGGPAVPDRFAELVRRRLSSLDDGAAGALRVAAVLGARFDVELLGAAMAAPIAVVADAMRSGIDAQLLSADQPGPTTFEFRHALTRDAILKQLLPVERVATARQALAALELVQPDLRDALGEQAASLAEEAGDTSRAAELLFMAAQRAQKRGALSSAVPMLRRAWSYVDREAPEWFEIGEALVSVLASTGAVDDALTIGQRLCDAAVGPDQLANVHLVAARAAAGASRWEAAGEYVTAARLHAELAAGHLVRAHVDAVSAEVAVGQGQFEDAAVLARSALKMAERGGDHELQAAAALVLGRCERGRGVGDPAATFDRVVRIGREHGLPAWQLRGLMERSSLALWRYEPPDRILAAREEAARAGALVVVAHLDNFLALQANDRCNNDQIEPAARRCIDLSEKLHLPALHGVATTALAFDAAHRGDREEMERLLADSLVISDHHPDVVALNSVARARFWMDRDDLAKTAIALGQVREGLRHAPALACPERGIWALFQALAGDEGNAAIEELDAYVGPNHVMIDSYRNYAKAVLRGRTGAIDDANGHIAAAERVQPTPWFQHYARRLVAESAHADGWGDPVNWLREGYSYFETRGDTHLAASCRSLLSQFGVALPRRRRSDERVPPDLRSLGVTARETEVLELLSEARSTRDIAETLHVSPKTIERHIANLATKLDVEGRTAVVAFAARFAWVDAV
jgi:DNA-binding CsgD family transcriptional regulator/tetratricopeptide (TPR) repeat protein